MNNTENVRIILRGLTAVEYSEVLKVPAGATREQLKKLVEQRYSVIGGGEYQTDHDYWEREDSRYELAEPTEKADGEVIIKDGEFQVTEFPVEPIDKPLPENMQECIASSLLALLGEHISSSPTAAGIIQKAAENLVSELATPQAANILSPEERDLLITSIGSVREYWQRNDGEWIQQIVRDGYLGWDNASDADLLFDALVANCAVHEPQIDNDRLLMIKIATRPDVLQLLFSTPDHLEQAQGLLQEISTIEFSASEMDDEAACLIKGATEFLLGNSDEPDSHTTEDIESPSMT